MPAPPLVLASTSPYRRALLARLGLPFDVLSPGVDEQPAPGEAPADLARRLADAKAAAGARLAPGRWVVGSDQVAELDGRALGKPGDAEGARAQLAAASGRELRFHTAVCVARDDGAAHRHLDTTTVRFRALSAGEIARYLAAEPAFDCAGSFKAEGLGITLFDAIVSEDPTALVGLPLVALSRLLRECGFALP